MRYLDDSCPSFWNLRCVICVNYGLDQDQIPGVWFSFPNRLSNTVCAFNSTSVCCGVLWIQNLPDQSLPMQAQCYPNIVFSLTLVPIPIHTHGVFAIYCIDFPACFLCSSLWKTLWSESLSYKGKWKIADFLISASHVFVIEFQEHVKLTGSLSAFPRVPLLCWHVIFQVIFGNLKPVRDRRCRALHGCCSFGRVCSFKTTKATRRNLGSLTLFLSLGMQNIYEDF